MAQNYRAPRSFSSREEAQARLQRQRKYNRLRKQRQRARHRPPSKAAQRDEAVLRLIKNGAGTRKQLYRRARHCPAFWPAIVAVNCMLDLNQLRANAIREQVRRAVERLQRSGRIVWRDGAFQLVRGDTKRAFSTHAARVRLPQAETVDAIVG